MKFIGLIVLLGALIALPPTVTALDFGSTAPKAEVKMKNIDGKMLSINDVKGSKGTLVIFTCNACPWVKAWESRIAEIGNSAMKQGLGVIAINSNDPQKVAEDGYEVMQTRAKEFKVNYPYVVDATSEVAAAFGATKTPEAYLFDKDGKLVYHGAIDDNAQEPDKVTTQYLKDACNSVVNGSTIAVKETKALGCGIKFHDKKGS